LSDHLEKKIPHNWALASPQSFDDQVAFFFKGTNIPEEYWKTAQGMGVYTDLITAQGMGVYRDVTTVDDDDDSDDVYVSRSVDTPELADGFALFLFVLCLVS
jgi:hypothetical protein